MQRLLLEREFLSPTTCDLLVQFFRTNIDELGCPDAEPTFEDRVIHYRNLDSGNAAHAQTKRVMNAVRFVISQKIAAHFRQRCVLPEVTQLVIWKEGMSQSFHLDRARATTTYAAIVYLNADFEGGETIFRGIKPVRPTTGAMIAFNGRNEPHGVSRVRSGTRFTLPVWFTEDPSAIEY
jgi:hypothetical protein